jgi:hypothetical protein
MEPAGSKVPRSALATTQGLSPRGGLKEAYSKRASRWTKIGRRRECRTSGPRTAKSISIKDAKRRPGDDARKATELNLPQEICSVSLRRLRAP